MKLVYANRRDDAPCPDTHIETNAGNLANAPRRVAKGEAVKPLRQAHEEQEKLSAEIAERQAALDAARAKAVAIQSHYDELRGQAAELPAQIARAESELETSKSRIAAIEVDIEQNWQLRGIADSLTELQRRQCLADRLPIYISKMRSRLEALKVEIADFATENGVGQ